MAQGLLFLFGGEKAVELLSLAGAAISAVLAGKGAADLYNKYGPKPAYHASQAHEEGADKVKQATEQETKQNASTTTHCETKPPEKPPEEEGEKSEEELRKEASRRGSELVK